CTHYAAEHWSSCGCATLSERLDYSGLPVHRSWWVAQDAISGIARNGRSYRLKLNSCIEVPISRRSMAK
ncbi:LytTR family transcriptional regulator DNA-binding domain-containing protein, partial [Enterococcus faecium]|uniref:LytTR family transcriptional regulator DNA-binding domain-containing protein n=2 Tax=Bacteria TaxID=2 RepID=UPI003F5208A3